MATKTLPPDTPALRTPLRGHQSDAVDAVCNAFFTGMPRASVQAACGTGKTRMGLHVAHEIAPCGRVLVVVPRLKLVEQSIEEWHDEGRQGPYLALCSKNFDKPAVAAFAQRSSSLPALAALATVQGPVNFFVTYQSLHKIIEGHAQHLLPPWDLIIVDEAHCTAGSMDKQWAKIHDNRAIPARHRFYMTATPKNVADPENNDQLTCEVASMNDQSLYGPVVYRISLAESIEQGLLADYRLVVTVIHDEALRRVLNHNTDTSPEAEGLRVAAAQVALLYAMRKHDLRRTLSHSRVKSAEIFAQTLHETATLMPHENSGDLWTGTVSSHQTRFDRLAIFSQFADHAAFTAAPSARTRRRVLTNSRLCLEGIDVPAIDSILFADPKSSTIDIVQGVGRALRQVPGTGKIATIIVPIYLGPDDDPASGMKRSPYFLLHQVMVALRVYDEHVIHRVEFTTLEELDQRRFVPPPARPERADEIIPTLALNALDPHHRVWPMGLASAERFHAQHGHLDVPSRYCGPDRFYLGWWIGHQRSLHANGLLLRQRADALDQLGLRWEHPRHSIEFRLKINREYVRHHGHLAPLSDESFHGTRIGRWVAHHLAEARNKTLPHPYRRALDEIDPWWSAPWSKTWKRTYAQALAAAHAGTLRFPALRSRSRAPLTRWLDQQIDNLPDLHPDQRNLLGALHLDDPLAIMLRLHRSPAERRFVNGLRFARAFFREHQHLEVPYDYTVIDTAGRRFRLGAWISDKRRNPADLTGEQLDALQALHMRWLPRQRDGSDPGHRFDCGDSFDYDY